MAMKTITFSLDSSSINRAIREVRAYSEEVKQKTEQLRKKVAERIQWSASQGFSSAVVSDVFKGDPPKTSAVTVNITHGDQVSIVFTDGEEAVFIEYGAGVYHNGGQGMIGSSPHPWVQNGVETRPFFIGMYGHGKGARNAWNIDRDTVTHGTPAAMPMYRGFMEAKNALDEMVREVFG